MVNDSYDRFQGWVVQLFDRTEEIEAAASYNDPNQTRVNEFEYDANNNLIRRVDGRGQMAERIYDDSNRLESI